jgi:hypothetical protein
MLIKTMPVVVAAALLGFASLAMTAPKTDTPDSDWTVLTMAPDGSWGVAIEPEVNRAIAVAIARCKAMYKKEIGCGAQFTTIRAGWSLAIRCGSENIIVAEKDLADAETAAARRENELRVHYVREMPACTRVLTVDPHGIIVRKNLALVH